MYNNKEAYKIDLKEAIKDLEEYIIRSKETHLYKIVVEWVEKPLIELALERTFGNKIKAARLLGINRNTLHCKIKKYSIDVSRFKY